MKKDAKKLRGQKNPRKEVREFVKVIHLKIKKHKPKDNKIMSLYDLITK